jgi:hypothetical protein
MLNQNLAHKISSCVSGYASMNSFKKQNTFSKIMADNVEDKLLLDPHERALLLGEKLKSKKEGDQQNYVKLSMDQYTVISE